MVRVRVLGAVELQVGHRRIGMNTEVLFALALYLTTRAGERVPRDELLELFWGKGSEEKQRHALRQMLYRLRQKGMPLDEAGDRVTVDPARVDSDVRYALDPAWVEKAVAAEIDAAGGFVLTFSRRLTPQFLAWVEETRDRVGAQHRKASLRQITVARREGRWADLERWAQSVLRTDPLNEDATMARAESAAMAGSKTMALEILDEYLAEVGEISPELGKPVLALRKRLAERRPDWTLRGPKEVALVGRTELMTRLTGLVEAAWRGEGSAVVLTGPAGIGKTRLALETRAYAELKGMRTVVVRAELGQVERPMAFLQSLVGEMVELSGAAGCDPDSFAMLRRLLERTHGQDQLGSGALPERTVTLLSMAVADLAAAVASTARTLVLIDDLHCADPLSRAIFTSAAKSSAKSRIAWLATERATQHRSDPEPTGLTRIRVPALSASAAGELAQATYVAHSLSLDPKSLQAVVDIAAGNPLFVRELSLARSRNPRDMRLPDTLSQLIADRLDKLPRSSIRLLRAIAILGHAATVSRLPGFSGTTLEKLTEDIELLEHEGVVGVEDGRILRVHDCWRDAILASLTPATRTSLAYECAMLLSNDSALESDPQLMWRAADLFAEAGNTERAVPFYLGAADQLNALGFPEEAITVAARSQELALSHADRLQATARIARYSVTAGRVKDALRIAREATSSVWRIPRESTMELVKCHLVEAEAAMHMFEHPRASMDILAEFAYDARLTAQNQGLVCLHGARISANAGYLSSLKQFYDRSAELAYITGQNCSSWMTATIFASENESREQILWQVRQFDSLDLSALSMADLCMLFRFRCQSLRVAGSLSEALESGRRAYELALSTGLAHQALVTAELLTFVFLDENDLENAGRWLELAARPHEPADLDRLPRTLVHAADRFLLQSEHLLELAERLTDRLDKLRGYGSERSRSGELATLAYSLAMVGKSEEALTVVGEANGLLERIAGSFSAQFPSELIARTYRVLGETEKARQTAGLHLRNMPRNRPRAFPAFFSELNSASAVTLDS
jgi:DNA-binding SARP family transcriptional activator